jgi:NitT/TauT family transport system substrate-binding protein
MKINLKSTVLFFIIALAFTGALHARGAAEPGNEDLTVYALKGPSGIGMIRLFEELPQIRGFNVKVEALAQADLMAARLISGEAKIGILPPNVAAKIAASGKNIRIAAVTGTGMLSLLSADSGVRSIGDLRGKTVEVAGQGATPDYVFRRILLSRGLSPDRDLNLSYSLAYPEIAQSLIAGRVSLALLPEPFATMARAGKRDLALVGDIQEEWIRAGGQGNYPMTVFVVDGDFAADHPGALESILAALEASIKWTAANPAEAGILVEKHGLGLKAPVAAAAIPRSNYVFIPAREAKASLESLYKAFLEFAPASIGGSLPKDDFYSLRRVHTPAPWG